MQVSNNCINNVNNYTYPKYQTKSIETTVVNNKELCDKTSAQTMKALAFCGLNNNYENAIFVDDDTSLFADAVKKPELTLDNLQKESIVLVHMTDYFPKEGKIISTKQAKKYDNNLSEPRSTIHFAMNKSVTEHSIGNNWNTMNYAIILPFDKTVETTPTEKVLGGFNDDFFIQDEVKLPEGSIILKFNNTIPKGKLKISQATENGQILKGIKLIESSDNQLGAVASRIVEKMGYDSFNDIHKKELGLTEEEYELLSTDTSKMTEEDIEKAIKIRLEHDSQFVEYDKKLSSKMREFMKKNNYVYGLHSISPWGRSELLIQGIYGLRTYNDNSWEGKDYYDRPVDYKKEFITVLEECKEQLPKGKNLSFDTNKMSKIIEESKTPQEAEERIKNELKLIHMPPKKDVSNNNIDKEIIKEQLYMTLDSVLGLSEENKAIIMQNYM